MSPSSACHHLKTLLKNAKLPEIRFHDLRHTFATHALASGVVGGFMEDIFGKELKPWAENENATHHAGKLRKPQMQNNDNPR